MTGLTGLHSRLPIIDLASFIANKQASGRPKDLADLASLGGNNGTPTPET